MSDKKSDSHSEYVNDAKCGEKPMQLLEIGTMNIMGKEFSAYGGAVCEGEFIEGYITIYKKNNWENHSKSFGGVLKTWDGKQTISKECHQLLEFYHSYKELSLWAVKYNGKWYVGGKDEDFFSGKYVPTTSFEDWLENQEQFEEYNEKNWDSKEDYEYDKEKWLEQKKEEFEDFEFEEATEGINENCEADDYFNLEEENEESDEDEEENKEQ